MTSYKGRKVCVLLFPVRACYHPRDKGTVDFPPGEGGGGEVAAEAGDLNSLTLLTVSDIFNSIPFHSFFLFFFFNCIYAKLKKSDLPYHLPVSISLSAREATGNQCLP